MCSCACGYANGYVNRMLQHVRHKFCWKAVVVNATNPLQVPNTGKDPRRDEPGHRQTNTLT